MYQIIKTYFFVQLQGRPFTFNKMLLYFTDANMWYAAFPLMQNDTGGFGKPAKNKTPYWKERDDLTGGPPMKKQEPNAVF